LPRRDFLKACKKLSVNQSIQPDGLIREWTRIGYQRVNTVLEPGQFSHRGGLLDVWPSIEMNPVRLDFFGDEIETIRSFDPPHSARLKNLRTFSLRLRVNFYRPERMMQFSFPNFTFRCLHSQPASLA
jgi:transcription-repair coupling factor (superfamily II helicase)